MARRKPRVQECRKRYEGKCFVPGCTCTEYESLQAHRILPGEQGGKYNWTNVLVLCASHHALVTAGVIRIHRRFEGMNSTVIHWTDAQGVEHYTAETRTP